MRKVKYKKLTIQNFLSIGNDAVVIDYHKGLNLITGKNIDNPERKNGSGKSCIIEAHYFALFGETIRKIKKDFIVNNVTKGKGRIELEFDVEDKGIQTYKIIRQVKPAKVELWKGDEDITRDSISNTNKYIETLLGTNSVFCKNCDILSLNVEDPFMSKGAAEKRKFIEDIFSLEVFAKMVKDLKEMIKENRNDQSISRTKYEEIKNTLQTLTKEEERMEENRRKRRDKLTWRKEELHDEIETLKTKIDELKIGDAESIKKDILKYDTALDKLDILLGKLNKDKTQREMSIDIKKKELKKIESVDGVKCDKCLQDIGEGHKTHLIEMSNGLGMEIDLLNKEIIQFNDKISDNTTKKNKIKRKIQELNSKVEEIREDERKLEKFKSNLEYKQKEYEAVENDLEKSDEEFPSFEKSIEETKEREKTEKENLDQLVERSDDLSVCSFILGEEGVKSFVIKKLLKLLNGSIQQYIIDLGMNIRCEFDEYFEEKMSNEAGVEICYHNLSGGERRTIDLACSWAFKDLKSKISNISSNLELMDEWTDSAFDSLGFDKLISCILNRIEKNDMCYYVISHRSETYKHINGEVVTLEKEGRITRRVKNDT